MIGFYSNIWEDHEFLTIFNFINDCNHFSNIGLDRLSLGFKILTYSNETTT